MDQRDTTPPCGGDGGPELYGGSVPPRKIIHGQQFAAQGSAQTQARTGVHARGPGTIRERMEVVGPDGRHVGTVDAVEGGQIRLTRASSQSDRHTYVPLSLVAGVEANRVCLAERGDASFGLPSQG